jgi:glutamate 5-kinase
LPQVENIADVKKMAGGSAGVYGSGGAAAKVSAAELAVENGITTVIVQGSEPGVIYRILNGEAAGTLFVAQNPAERTE